MILRFASTAIVTILILHSSPFTNLVTAAKTTLRVQVQVQAGPSTGSPVGAETTVTPSAILKQAVELAQQGDVQGGMTKAADAKQLAQQSGQFGSMLVVEYLNTIKELASLAQPDQAAKLKVEVSTTVDQFGLNPEFDGRGNPQTAYYFMTSLKQTAEVFLRHDSAFFVQLLLQQGAIARNLKANPNYPADGRAFLADSIAGLAVALALKTDVPGANQALTEACEMGFCEFEKLDGIEALNQVQGHEAFAAHRNQLRERYLAGLKDWSSAEINRFQAFRFNFHIDSVKGGSLSSRNQVGKIMVVDLWATWCPPCRETLPHFDRLHKEYRKSGVRVIGISMDSPETPHQSLEKVREFLAENELNFPCGMGTQDLKNQLPPDMKLPTTLFIDRSGTVRYMTNGYQDYAKVAAITETLLNEKLPVATHAQDFRQEQ